MAKVPADLRYTKDHGWVRVISGADVEVGVTDFGQASLGDLISVTLPKVGLSVNVGETYVTLESAKTAFDVASPLAGHVIAVNSELLNSPTSVNDDPYGAGWLARLRVSDPKAVGMLLDAAAYEAVEK